MASYLNIYTKFVYIYSITYCLQICLTVHFDYYKLILFLSIICTVYIMWIRLQSSTILFSGRSISKSQNLQNFIFFRMISKHDTVIGFGWKKNWPWENSRNTYFYVSILEFLSLAPLKFLIFITPNTSKLRCLLNN